MKLLQDARHAWRSLAKSPGFVAVAVLSLAFGIGVNTAIFTLVNGILLQELPVHDPHRIVQIDARAKDFENHRSNFPAFRELRRQDAIFSDAVAFSPKTGIGVRMSVGAQTGDVLWLFARESLALTAIGMLLGLPLALMLARFAKKMLYEVRTSDPLGVGVTLALLALGALLAAYFPGRRATRIDPVQALRCD